LFTSTYSILLSQSRPIPCIIKSHCSPISTVIDLVVSEKPFGPHHSFMCSGVVHTSQTKSIGASRSLVCVIRLSSCLNVLYSFIFLFLLFLNFCQITFQ